ncbi:hypothetical protein POM88_040395 [Heracleum sosnowskyi]|uniref:Uncharacterized protein n=1 Tax=Heracleum sosnowskyi TaxID=360622 RepID=A0AAD8M9S3_9APIA|nr:hypothetical protein POM88_040395 [Heracleum sosnowskyi]
MKTQSPRVLTQKDTKQSPKKLSEFEKLVQVCKVTTLLYYQQNSQQVSKRNNIDSIRFSVFEKNWGKKPIQDSKDLVGSTCCISREELFNGSIPNVRGSSSGSFCKLKIKRSGDNYDYLEGKKVVEGNDNNGYFPNKKSDPFGEQKAFDGARGKKRSRKCFDLSKDDQDFEYSEKEKKPRTICNARHKIFKVASPLPVVFKNEIQEMGGTDIKLIIQKNLFSADTEGGQNRFSIPMRQIRENFLTVEEESILDQRFKDNHVVPLMVPLIEPNLKKAQINFRKWAVNSSYVLSSPWNEIRDRNELRAKMEMQLWSFRVDGALNFAMVKVSDGV